MRPRRFSAGLTFMLAGALLAGGGCSGEVAPAKGQLMVVLQSDMAVPKDINRAQVLITVQGKVVFTKLYIADIAGELKLPGTIAVVAGEKEAEQVVVQVVGIDKNGDALTFNKAVTTMPRSRIATLRMPMQWLCSGQVDTLTNSGDPVYASSCRDTSMGEQSCLAGSCTSIDIDEASLPDFNPPEVFGGGEYPNDPSGQCFDVQSCFKLGVTLTPDLNPTSPTYCQASVTVPANADLNFAVDTGPEGAGVCDDRNAAAPCFVVLDQSETFGWTALNDAEPSMTGSADTGAGAAGRTSSSGGQAPAGAGASSGAAGGVGGAPGAGGATGVGGSFGSAGKSASGGAPSGGNGSGGSPSAGAGGAPPVSAYISSGAWHGHIFTAKGAGSSINPSVPPVTDFPLCVSGVVAASVDSSNYAAVGFNLNQAPNGPSALEVFPQSSSGGVNVQLTNDGGSLLRLRLNGADAASDPSQQWCSEIAPSGQVVPWDSFSNECWTGEGAPYGATTMPIVSVEVVVPGDTVATPFDFCIDDLSEAFILPKLKPPLQARSITPPGLHPLQAGGDDASGTVVVQFPTAVCDRLNDDPTLKLSATAACEAKTEKTPLCGPWSTASAPQVPNPDITLPEEGAGGTGGMSGSGEGGAPPGEGGAGGVGQAGAGTGSIDECGAQVAHPDTSPVIASFDSPQPEPGIDQLDARRGFAFSVGYGGCEPASLAKLEPGPASAHYLRFQDVSSCSMIQGEAVTLVVPFNATGFANTDQSMPPDSMCPYSASAYTGISFLAKAPTSHNLQVALLTPSTVSSTDLVPGGTCLSNCAPRAVNMTLTSDWQQYQVLFGALEANPNQLLGIQFQSTAESENMFDIDQITFIGGN